MKYIEYSILEEKEPALFTFREFFIKEFKDRMPLTIENLTLLYRNKWNIGRCLCSFIPGGQERDAFENLDPSNVIAYYEELTKYAMRKSSLVDKIVDQVNR